jgi:hypothetical protein
MYVGEHYSSSDYALHSLGQSDQGSVWTMPLVAGAIGAALFAIGDEEPIAGGITGFLVFATMGGVYTSLSRLSEQQQSA